MNYDQLIDEIKVGLAVCRTASEIKEPSEFKKGYEKALVDLLEMINKYGKQS